MKEIKLEIEDELFKDVSTAISQQKTRNQRMLLNEFVNCIDFGIKSNSNSVKMEYIDESKNQINANYK
jgi:hypothetical protein